MRVKSAMLAEFTSYVGVKPAKKYILKTFYLTKCSFHNKKITLQYIVLTKAYLYVILFQFSSQPILIY